MQESDSKGKDECEVEGICCDLERFISGVKGFKERFYRRYPEHMQQLVERGQRPVALMIACSDSRVDPALLMNVAPGDLFVVRNVANLVPPYHGSSAPDGVGAALEYAVRHLHVPHVIVLGHAQCGGIKALLDMATGAEFESDFIGEWVSMAMEACWQYVPDASGEGLRRVSLERLKDYSYLVERAAIQGSLGNLLTYPWVREAVEKERLFLQGWWFDLESGDLWVTSGDNSQFLPVTD
ncbi:MULTISPECIES: carbonic anhydrase [Methylococcus]|uniref:Carbonic anhydrase n=1 Tax=Methylococcus capsulatus (strain ATCC 33009 / NCIMB 11132 / Bath) TaxID=243233 RepID=Q607T9_METCA|nr:carbonic anhydrase [Methylococcus capsulatus]AAU92288.1 carbonic anhydrase [Methylococcus capsulatus str. Bath]